MYTRIPMVPGPVTVPPSVLNALCQDYASGQIDPEFLQLYKKTAQSLASMAKTKNDVLIMTGEAMLVLWGALKSTLQAGDSVLCIGTGIFGDGFGEMAKSIGCTVHALSLPHNETIRDMNQIAECIKKVRPKMITVVHCETPSGTLNPLAELGALKKELQVPLLYVDAVASWGGAPILADEWNIDILLGGTQKCFSAPPSLGFVALSPTAWEYIETVKYEGYDAFLPFKTIYTDGRCPYTPYWQGVAGLYEACTLIMDEGVETVFKRHETVAHICRQGLAELDIKLWPVASAINSPTVTAAYIPANFTWQEWQKTLAAKGLAIAGSFGEMAGKIFRLGHMGTQANETLVHNALATIKTVLQK